MRKSRRLLIVDDEPLILELFSEILERWDYEVVTASNAIRAVEEISHSMFDAVVCDVMMEDFDGFDFLAMARQRNTTLGIVLVTGNPNESGRLRANSMRARYAEKPIGIERLLREIDAAIDLTRTANSQLIRSDDSIKQNQLASSKPPLKNRAAVGLG